MLQVIFFTVLGLALLALALKLLFPLPARDNFPADQPIPAMQVSHPDIQTLVEETDQGESGILLLTTGLEAVSARLAIIRHAKSTIDAQYYIWEGDLSGRMMLEEVIAAADRGVRVRLLIDDNPTAGLDPMWATITSHPNIAVRIFNPLTIRAFRPANYLFDFPRLNRRMHNKSLTIDNAVTVVGGRNVGDVYFGAANEGLFIDLDALAVGAVVPEVSQEFERYWVSEAAYPAELILNMSKAEPMDNYRELVYSDPQRAADYREATNSFANRLASIPPDELLTFAKVDLLSDNPIKAAGKAKGDDLMATHLRRLIESADTNFDLVSGYFVPTDDGVDLISGVARRGVETRVATNGISVTDVPVVHAGYYPSRKPLLEAGVAIYEAKPQKHPQSRERDLGMVKFSGGGESVHAKTFAIDHKKLFVGSFNFDPRSAQLNCEMGFVINSPELATRFGSALDDNLGKEAYALSLDSDDDIVWTTVSDGKVTQTTTEPGTTAFSRSMVWVLSKLPIAWML